MATAIKNKVDVVAHKVNVPSFGFMGKIASGKTTYANLLKEQIEKRFAVQVHRLSYRTIITKFAEDIFDTCGDNRKLLQDLGNKMKEIDPSVWVNYMVRDVKEHGKLPFIVDGIRFPEDAAGFRNGFSDFILIKIESDEKQRLDIYKKVYGRPPTSAELKDPTENSADGIRADLVLNNTYKMSDLERQIGSIVENIGNGTITRLLWKDRPVRDG